MPLRDYADSLAGDVASLNAGEIMSPFSRAMLTVRQVCDIGMVILLILMVATLYVMAVDRGAIRSPWVERWILPKVRWIRNWRAPDWMGTSGAPERPGSRGAPPVIDSRATVIHERPAGEEDPR